MERRQREALHSLLKACSALQRKKWTTVDLDLLKARVLTAVCMVEAHLPINEMDMKLHALTHLVEKVYATGPLWVTSMFSYESLWGRMTRWARNQNAPEVSMVHTYGVHEATLFLFLTNPKAYAFKPSDRFIDEEFQLSRYQFHRGGSHEVCVKMKGLAVMIDKPEQNLLLAMHEYYREWDDG